MRFTLKKDKSGVVIVGVEGQLIVGNRQELKQKVLDALEEGSRKFVIDFSKTGYIDSSGLGVLVSLSKKIREQGGELRLAGLNADLQTLFELTKLRRTPGCPGSSRRRRRRTRASPAQACPTASRCPLSAAGPPSSSRAGTSGRTDASTAPRRRRRGSGCGRAPPTLRRT